MYQVSNIFKLLTLISFRTDNFGGKIGRVIIFKMADCTQRNCPKLTRKLTVIQWFYSNITHMRYTYQLILLYSVRIFSILNEYSRFWYWKLSYGSSLWTAFLNMAAERYLSRRIPDLRVGNDIDKIDKKQIQVILWSMVYNSLAWVPVWSFFLLFYFSVPWSKMTVNINRNQ